MQLQALDNTGGASQITDLSQLGVLITAPPPLPKLQQIEIVVNGVLVEVIPADDPRIISTPLGLRLDCAEISACR